MVPPNSSSLPSAPTAALAEQFLREGAILRDWSPRTIATHRASLATFPLDQPLTKATLNTWVAALRERGITAGGVNLRARSLNSFLSWLHQEGHTAERLRVRLLKNPPKPIDLLTDADVRRLLAFRAKSPVQQRAWALTVVLLDTGMRISEALNLERRNVNLDDCVLRVLGKGHRERFVPISIEARKHVFRLLSKGTGPFVFSTRDGERLAYRNIHRDLTHLCKRLGIRAATNPHAFRHYFAVNYIRAGGDIYRLSRILGHSSLTTTQLYLRSMGVEHLREGHRSPLMRS
jgi:integrase/recombinase XerD